MNSGMKKQLFRSQNPIGTVDRTTSILFFNDLMTPSKILVSHLLSRESGVGRHKNITSDSKSTYDKVVPNGSHFSELESYINKVISELAKSLVALPT